MRIATLALVGALGFGFSAVSANASPAIPNPGIQQTSNILQAADGCGRGYQLNRWGHCSPNRGNYDRGYGNYRQGYQDHGWRSRNDNATHYWNRQENSGSSMPHRW